MRSARNIPFAGSDSATWIATSEISQRHFFLPHLTFPTSKYAAAIKTQSFSLSLVKKRRILRRFSLSRCQRSSGHRERERERGGEMEDDEEKVKKEALQIIGQFQELPRLVVFDLDYTLWPFYWFVSMAAYIIPFSLWKICNGRWKILIFQFYDLISEFYYEDDTPYLYPHAMGILKALKEKGIELAIASRSPTSQIAKAFLVKLGIDSMCVAQVLTSWCDCSCNLRYECFLDLCNFISMISFIILNHVLS